MRPGDHHHLLDSGKTLEDKVVLFAHLFLLQTCIHIPLQAQKVKIMILAYFCTCVYFNNGACKVRQCLLNEHFSR